jgi:class 3 adenylate cyclase/predicted ATPase
VAAQPGPSAAPVVQDSAERRQLTVMFCDLVGSTALSGRLDPEDLRSVIGTYHKCVAETVARFEGFVAKYMGDGVLVYFGYPHAHEDDAERAARAALGLVEAVPKLSTAPEIPLQVRIGIATGLVVVGDLIGAGAAQEQTVVGETPNLAARLQALAEPGAVVIASSTRQLTGGLFEYRDLGRVTLKGFAENVSAWQVLGVGAAESRFEALRATSTPLVGRDEEIDLLLRRWERAKRGDGCAVLMSGEPGIGKSRIAQTLQDRLRDDRHTRMRYFCSPHDQNSALYPIVTRLERTAGFRREDTAEQRLQKLEAILSQATNDLGEAVPLLAALMSIATGDHYPSLSLSPQKQKEKTLRALMAQIEGLAAQQPVLMVFEDIHWSDPTTRELLDLTIDRVPALAVLLIVTYRPEFTPPWIGRPDVTLLTLSRLPAREGAEMVARMTGNKPLPKEIAAEIIDRTDGVPLFIEELTKAVIESGVLTDAGDQYRITGPLPPMAIPTSLNASLLARLDRLAPVREVAQIGAAVGRQFSHELISALAPMPREQVDGALDQLVRAELVFRRGTPPDAEYTFKHALVQDAAYSTLLRSHRVQLHARIAAILEDQFPEIVETRPEALAHHCTEAGLAEKAVGYRLKAGQQAIARGAMTEALTEIRKGLDLLPRMLNGNTRREQELELQIALGSALTATKGYTAPESGEAFARARQMCEQLNHPPQLGRVLIGQFVFRLCRAELDRADYHAEEMRHLGAARDDVAWKFIGSQRSGTARAYLGKFIDARAYLESALSLWDPMHRAFWPSPEDVYVTTLIELSRTLLYLGYVDQAHLRRTEALTEARRCLSYTVAFALCLAWWGIDWQIEGVRSAPRILRSADEVLAISTEQGFPLYASFGKIMRGWCLSALAQTAEGIPLIHEGLAIWRGTGANLAVPIFLTMLAEAYGMAARPDEGLKQLDDAAGLVEKTNERWAEAEMHRMRGKLLLLIRQHAAAEVSYRYALESAQRQHAKFPELRAAADLALLWRDQGKRVEAHDLLARVYDWFTEGFDTPVLQEAKALLDELA